jgi:hypothetical protein
VSGTDSCPHRLYYFLNSCVTLAFTMVFSDMALYAQNVSKEILSILPALVYLQLQDTF